MKPYAKLLSNSIANFCLTATTTAASHHILPPQA